jgi:hypothetical protein
MTDPYAITENHINDNNSSLVSQTDVESQTITINHDSLNRLNGKEYSSSNMTNISHSYSGGTGNPPTLTSIIQPVKVSMFRGYIIAGYAYKKPRNAIG